MDKHHAQILREIKKNAGKVAVAEKEWVKKYMGTRKVFYSLRSEVKNRIVRDWIKNHKNISLTEYEKFLNSLYNGKSHEEFSFAGRLLEYLPKFRTQLDPDCLDRWLDKAEGWGEVDSMCQSNFSAKEMLANWNKWKKLLAKFAKDKNIHKRRASLVLLTKAVRESDDKRLSDLAFANISRLKKEKEILITKAISWLLRSLVKNHKAEIQKYLIANLDLPKIAIRETKAVLINGKKTK
jgi:3-methyladenine DNA glycosylase AlkD